jgi:hypothetical protein
MSQDVTSKALKGILSLLKNDSEYYRGIGLSYLSNSDIGTLLNNPAAFGRVREDDSALAAGRLFHQLILEPHKVIDFPHIDVSTRTTKAYKEFLEANGLTYAMLTREVENISELTKVMTGNIQFYDDIYRDENQYEVPAVGEVCGMMFKGKADIVCDDCLIDLKTTSDLGSFKWSARKYNYDSQAYIYQQLFNKPLVFYAIDKETKQLGIFRPTENFLATGKSKVERAIAVWQKYFGPDALEDVDNHYVDEYLD